MELISACGLAVVEQIGSRGRSRAWENVYVVVWNGVGRFCDARMRVVAVGGRGGDVTTASPNTNRSLLVVIGSRKKKNTYISTKKQKKFTNG